MSDTEKLNKTVAKIKMKMEALKKKNRLYLDLIQALETEIAVLREQPF